MNWLTNLTCLDWLSKLLPNIDEIVDEQNYKTNELAIDKMTDILPQNDNDKIPLELAFFGGWENQLFNNYVKALRLSPNSLEFVDFLQSDEYKEILLASKLKVRVETGNIYYDDQDTNESIYSFFLVQQDPDKAFIDFEFTFPDSYEDYFE